MNAYQANYSTLNKIAVSVSNQVGLQTQHDVRDKVLDETADEVEELMAMVEEELADYLYEY